jgi:predicted amidohydrolase
MTIVAAIQMTSGTDVAANLATAGRLLEQAAERGAVIAALPENFALMGRHESDKQAIAETQGSGPIQDFLASAAQRLKIWVIGGTMPMRCADPQEPRPVAACVVYDRDGGQRARYDKIHLFDVDVPDGSEAHRESHGLCPGQEPTVLETPAGKLGLAVCYDIRFPELFRRLSAAGAEWFCLPSAFTRSTGRAHWETLIRARAIENLCFMMAPAQSGAHPNGRETYGDTMLVDYWGRVLSRLPRGQGVVTADFDHTGQAQVRRDFPALKHRVFMPG